MVDRPRVRRLRDESGAARGIGRRNHGDRRDEHAESQGQSCQARPREHQAHSSPLRPHVIRLPRTHGLTCFWNGDASPVRRSTRLPIGWSEPLSSRSVAPSIFFPEATATGPQLARPTHGHQSAATGSDQERGPRLMPSLSSSIPVQLEMNRPDVRIEWMARIDSDVLGPSAILGNLARLGSNRMSAEYVRACTRWVAIAVDDRSSRSARSVDDRDELGGELADPREIAARNGLGVDQ